MTIVLCGQIRGGKNNMQTRRDGRHYPNPLFVAWRKDMALQIKAQLIHKQTQPLDIPLRMKVDYWSGDRKTRDVPAMLDALFHVLVYCGVLKDDGLVRDVLWYNNGVNTRFPKVVMELTIAG